MTLTAEQLGRIEENRAKALARKAKMKAEKDAEMKAKQDAEMKAKQDAPAILSGQCFQSPRLPTSTCANIFG